MRIGAPPPDKWIYLVAYCLDITDLDPIEFDLIFTSPPFWQDNIMVECYNCCDDDYEKFLEESLFPIIDEGLERNIWVCLHLPLQMYKDIKKEFGPATKIIYVNKNNKIKMIKYTYTQFKYEKIINDTIKYMSFLIYLLSI